MGIRERLKDSLNIILNEDNYEVILEGWNSFKKDLGQRAIEDFGEEKAQEILKHLRKITMKYFPHGGEEKYVLTMYEWIKQGTMVIPEDIEETVQLLLNLKRSIKVHKNKPAVQELGDFETLKTFRSPGQLNKALFKAMGGIEGKEQSGKLTKYLVNFQKLDEADGYMLWLYNKPEQRLLFYKDPKDGSSDIGCTWCVTGNTAYAKSVTSVPGFEYFYITKGHDRYVLMFDKKHNMELKDRLDEVPSKELITTPGIAEILNRWISKKDFMKSLGIKPEDIAGLEI